MGLRALIATLLVLAGTAEAGHKLFMLRSDSTTDWATRTHVEKTVLGLARNVDRGIGRGDMTFADVALSVGCTKDLDGCRTPLLDALMIDELVVISIVPTGDKVKVTVRRASRAGIREATATADKDNPDPALVASIGPLFGTHKIVGEPARPVAKSSKATMTTGTVEVDNEQPPPLKQSEPAKPAPAPPPPPPPPPPAPAPAAPPPTVASAEPAPAPTTVTAAPDNVVDDGGHRPVYIGGVITGGVLAIVGVALWEKARGIESDARVAPNRTSTDIANLLDLESSGDHYALAGNIAFVGGLAIAGVSGFLWWRSTRVAPLAVDHGGGVAVTFEVP